MNNRAPLSLAIICLTAFGCAAPVGAPEPDFVADSAAKANAVVCTNGPCPISVVCVDGKAYGSPDYYIPPGYTPMITWTVITPNYTFVDDGISFKTQTGKDTFNGQNPQPGTRFAQYRNTHKNKGSFSYSIYLQGPGGSRCEYDPTVFNG